MGPQAGRKVFTLQTLPAYDVEEPFSGAAGQVEAGIAIDVFTLAEVGEVAIDIVDAEHLISLVHRQQALIGTS